jgi:hypothetical protein
MGWGARAAYSVVQAGREAHERILGAIEPPESEMPAGLGQRVRARLHQPAAKFGRNAMPCIGRGPSHERHHRLNARVGRHLVLASSFCRAKDSKKDADDIANRDTGKRVSFYSLEKEIALVNQMAQEVKWDAKIVGDPVVVEYITRLEKDQGRGGRQSVLDTSYDGRVRDTQKKHSGDSPRKAGVRPDSSIRKVRRRCCRTDAAARCRMAINRLAPCDALGNASADDGHFGQQGSDADERPSLKQPTRVGAGATEQGSHAGADQQALGSYSQSGACAGGRNIRWIVRLE